MNSESQVFQTLLVELGIEFTPPPSFVHCATRDNSMFRYQYAVRSPSGDLELRYRIDPIQRLEEERRIANEGIEVLASADLNNLHELSSAATVFNLSAGKTRPMTVFKPEHARELFGADWAATWFMQLASHDFTPDYDSVIVFCLHKDDVADVYLIGLFNDSGYTADMFGELPGFRFVEQLCSQVATAEETSPETDPSPISTSQIQKLLNIISGHLGRDFPMGKNIMGALGFPDDTNRSAYRGVVVGDNETNVNYQIDVLPNDSGYVLACQDEHGLRFMRLDAHFKHVCGIAIEATSKTPIKIPYAEAAKYWAADLAKWGKFADELDDA
ncbi:MAG: hypothetical protein KGL01_03425 [Betaproteobacteria bacterium]|nr:hypothetical protein [Betaproteobacteria bacterium]